MWGADQNCPKGIEACPARPSALEAPGLSVMSTPPHMVITWASNKVTLTQRSG